MLNKILQKIEDVQKQLKNSVQNSASGTLARSEAELILTLIKEVKCKLKSQDIQKLNDSILEETAGGNSKIAAATLAAITAIFSIPNTYATFSSKPNVNIISNKKLDISPKKFYKNHSQLLKATGTFTSIGAFGVALGATIATAKGAKRYLLGDIDKMSDEEALQEISKEIEKLKNLEKENLQEFLEVKGEEEYKKNPKLFLVYLREINKIFNDFPGFVKKLADCYKNRHTKFSIEFAPGAPNPISDLILGKVGDGHFRGFGSANFNSGIKFMNYPINQLLFGGNVVNKIGYNAPMEYKRILPAVASHELGHVIQYLISNSSNGDFSYDTAKEINQQIINIAKENYGQNINEKISTYGEKNPAEWFAEVFAHSQCCNNPNPLGQAMEKYLRQHGFR